MWPTSRTVQGHPRSKVMVPIDSPWVISYLTSFESNIVFEIFDAKILWPRSRTVQGRQGQRSWCQSIAHVWFPISLPLTLSSYLSPFSKYLTCNFNDLELGRFKVDRRSKVMVPIESPLVVSYLTSIGSNVVSRMVKINSTSGLADRNISDFHQKQ